MNKLIHALDKVLSIWCTFLMFVLTIGVIITVLLRYLFNITFIEAEMGITMIFVGTTYFGAALGIREKDHIAIPFLYEKFSPFWQKVIEVFVNLVIIFVVYIVFKQSLIWISRVGKVGLPSLFNIPKLYFYFMVPVSSVLIIFYCLVDILSIFVHVDEPDYGYDRGDFDEEACKEAQEELARDFKTERLLIKGSKKEQEERNRK